MRKNRKYVLSAVSTLLMVLVACGSGNGKTDGSAENGSVEVVSGKSVTKIASDSSSDKSSAQQMPEKEVVIGTEIVSDGRPTVVDFSAVWCGPCRMMKPVFERLAREFGKEYNFVTIDIDEHPEIAQKYGVQAVPTFVFLDENGKEGNRITGAVPEEKLRSELIEPVWN